MRILIFTLGSHGDVHPFVGLGITLRRRGHDVTLITNQHFESLVRAAGLEFAQSGTDEQFREMMNDPDLWHPWRGLDAVFLRGVIPQMEEAYRVIESLYEPGTLLVSNTLGFAARIANEKLGAPLATVHIQPAVIRTVHDVPKIPALFAPAWMPKWLKKVMWDGGDRYYIDPKIAPPINEFRAKLGLTEPVSGIINEWWHSPLRLIGLWPEWYGPRQPDWPERLKCVGFPLFDEEGITPLSDELDQWLRAGEPPIAFTPGSAMIQGASFFEESARACALLNRRGLLLTRHTDQIPQDAPSLGKSSPSPGTPGEGRGEGSNMRNNERPSPTPLPEYRERVRRLVRHVDYAPFGSLLPRCAALVHHGGIGTTAQTLRAGIPQLIMPLAHDQFDNVHRVKKLGVGDSIKVRKYRAPAVARKLAGLLENPKVRECGRQISAKFEGQKALEEAADWVEELAALQVPENAVLRTS